MRALGGIAVGVAALATAAAGAETLERHSASGPVQATVRLAPAEPVIGDALVFELEVRAEPYHCTYYRGTYYLGTWTLTEPTGRHHPYADKPTAKRSTRAT